MLSEKKWPQKGSKVILKQEKIEYERKVDWTDY